MYRRSKDARLLTGGLIGALPVTTPGDEHWNDVTLLLDGTSLTDQSIAGNNVSNAGSVLINQTTTGTGFDVEPKVYDINSSGTQYLYAADGSMDDLGDAAFTIEALVKVANTSTARGIFTTIRPEDTSPNHLSGVGLWVNGNGLLRGTINGADNTYAEHSGTIEDGNWHHVALVYDGTEYEVYLDGTASGSPVTATPIITSNSKVQIGKLYTNYNLFGLDGSVTQVRITKGVARYTAAFTPPTASFLTNAPVVGRRGVGTYDAGDEHWEDVSLLVRGDTMTDLSTNGHTLTNNGALAGDSEHKYSSGGSLLFDGTNDYVAVSNNISLDLGTGDFTIEMWVNLNTTSGNHYFFDLGTNGIALHYNSGFRVWVGADGVDATYSTTTSFTAGTWYHVALVRDGNTKRVFVDGSQVSSASTSLNSTGQDLTIGAYGSRAQNWTNGNLEDIRITKGVARYTAAFTPPTRSLPTALEGTAEATATLRTRGYVGAAPAALAVDTFATFDPANANSGMLFSDANLKLQAPDTSTWYNALTTQTVGPNDKVYFEWTTNQATWLGYMGLTASLPASGASSYVGKTSTDWGLHIPNANEVKATHNGTHTVIAGSGNDAPLILMCAIDRPSGEIHFGYNGLWCNNDGGYVTSSTPNIPVYTNIPTTGTYYVGGSASTYGSILYYLIANFGQDATFAGQKSPSTTYTDANGLGEFYYEPPAGFVGLYTTTGSDGGMLTLYDRYIDALG